MWVKLTDRQPPKYGEYKVKRRGPRQTDLRGSAPVERQQLRDTQELSDQRGQRMVGGSR